MKDDKTGECDNCGINDYLYAVIQDGKKYGVCGSRCAYLHVDGIHLPMTHKKEKDKDTNWHKLRGFEVAALFCFRVKAGELKLKKD